MKQAGSLIVVSGPSGSGKTTLTNAALAMIPNLRFSISYTTRKPRGNEKHGVQYFFVSEAEFKRMIENDEFLEWANVYGNLYGTSRRLVQEALDRGEDMVLDIDVQGARAVKRQIPDAVLIFLFPPSYEVLASRLRKRAEDSESAIQQRILTARREMRRYVDFDYLIVNDDLERAKEEIRSIIIAARCRRKQRESLAEEIIRNLGEGEE